LEARHAALAEKGRTVDAISEPARRKLQVETRQPCKTRRPRDGSGAAGSPDKGPAIPLQADAIQQGDDLDGKQLHKARKVER